MQRFFKWLKKWYWDIWFEQKPEPNEKYMYLSHEEKIEKLKEMVKK